MGERRDGTSGSNRLPATTQPGGPSSGAGHSTGPATHLFSFHGYRLVYRGRHVIPCQSGVETIRINSLDGQNRPTQTASFYFSDAIIAMLLIWQMARNPGRKIVTGDS